MAGATNTADGRGNKQKAAAGQLSPVVSRHNSMSVLVLLSLYDVLPGLMLTRSSSRRLLMLLLQAV